MNETTLNKEIVEEQNEIPVYIPGNVYVRARVGQVLTGFSRHGFYYPSG